MRYDVYEEIGRLELRKTTRLFTRLGNITTKSSGVFCLTFSIEEDAYKVEAYVVRTHLMMTKLILGGNFLENAEVIIRKGRVEIKRLLDENVAIPDCGELLLSKMINLLGSRLCLLNYIAIKEVEVAESYRSKVEAMIACQRITRKTTGRH